MGLVVIIIILALVFGVLGALVEGLLWLLFIGIALLVIGAVVGFLRRGGSRV